LFGFLINPEVAYAKGQALEAEQAARALGLQLLVVNATNESQIELAFKTLVDRRAGGLITISEPFLNSRRGRLIELAGRHKLPALYPVRDYVTAGGLMSYGTSIVAAYRQVGVYTGRILKGERPADLPVVRSTKLELVINLRTAKALSLDVPDRVLALADEVIE